jgi:GTPase SAR1 family protein
MPTADGQPYFIHLTTLMAQHTNEGMTQSNAKEDSMAEAIGEIVAGEVAKGAFSWLKQKYRTWRHGKTLLIVGPARVGKTNLFYYLLHRILNPEEITEPTQDITSHDSEPIPLKIGEGFTVIIRKPLDVPGDVKALRQIQYVETCEPHCLVIVLDATTFYTGKGEMDNSLAWLKEFCWHLNVSLTTNQKIARRLKSMFVIINKWDKVATKDKVESQDNKETWDIFELEVRDILDERLINPFYRKGGNKIIRVLPCALVQLIPPDETLAKRVRQSIIQSLR